jgi:DNA-binding PadR family transcriptional regulator
MMRDFFLGFVRLHLLHHASRSPIYGLDMIQEIRRHGYALSPGTLYPILHDLERKGYLESSREVVNGKARKNYRATRLGEEALREALLKARELLDEIGEGERE